MKPLKNPRRTSSYSASQYAGTRPANFPLVPILDSNSHERQRRLQTQPTLSQVKIDKEALPSLPPTPLPSPSSSQVSPSSSSNLKAYFAPAPISNPELPSSAASFVSTSHFSLDSDKESLSSSLEYESSKAGGGGGLGMSLGNLSNFFSSGRKLRKNKEKELNAASREFLP